jgi:hypothetical protein
VIFFAAARSGLVKTRAFGLRRRVCMFSSLCSNWRRVRRRSIHERALRQEVLACDA